MSLFRLLLLFCIALFVNAKELPFNLSAKEVFLTDKRVEAYGDVVVSGNGYVLRADSAKYYEENKTLLLDGAIEVYKDSKLYLMTESLKANIDMQKGFMEPFFMLERDNGVWIAATRSNLEDSVYSFDKCTLSSCDPENPKWYIESSSAKFDQNNSSVSARNPVFYLFDIPMFYLPYIWFSTDDTRRSGLLIPRVGYSDKEGFLYEQPIFVAPMDSWDLEVMPQIRTNRGQGAYSTFRFVDTNHSKGSIKLGYFDDKDSYTKDNDLRYGSHYGYELRYENSDIFSSKSSFIEGDGLYLDWVYLNDVDYKNLQRDSEINIGDDNFVTSELNYVASSEKDYFALYNKYFIDTGIYDNSSTLQRFPSLNYHRYTDTLFNDYVLYGIDYKYGRFYRESGLNGSLNEFFIPVGTVIPFANEFLTFSFFYNTYFNNTEYSTPNMVINQEYDDGHFLRSYSNFTIESDLTREYEDFLHTVNLKANYLLPGVKEKKGYYPDFITLPSDSEEAKFDLLQYFYDNKLFNFFYHRLSQPVYFNDYVHKYGELMNEIRYRYNRNIEVYNRFRYMHERGRFTRSSTGINLGFFPYKFEFSHYYDDGNLSKAGTTSDFFIVGAEKRFDDFSLYGKIGYDNDDKFVRWWESGIYNKARCLDYKVSIRRESTPVLKSGGSSSMDETKFYIELIFVPLFGVKQSVKAG